MCETVGKTVFVFVSVVACSVFSLALISSWYAPFLVSLQLYEGSIIPCNSMMVVDLGASECRIEAVMHDFIQVEFETSSKFAPLSLFICSKLDTALPSLYPRKRLIDSSL